MTKDDIEKQLKRYLGVEKVIWLPRGLFGTFRCSLSGLCLGQHHQDTILYIYSLVIFYTQLLFPQLATNNILSGLLIICEKGLILA
jgi:hypothetical protein